MSRIYGWNAFSQERMGPSIRRRKKKWYPRMLWGLTVRSVTDSEVGFLHVWCRLGHQKWPLVGGISGLKVRGTSTTLSLLLVRCVCVLFLCCHMHIIMKCTVTGGCWLTALTTTFRRIHPAFWKWNWNTVNFNVTSFLAPHLRRCTISSLWWLSHLWRYTHS